MTKYKNDERIYFLKFEKGKNLTENCAINVGRIMYKMKFQDEILIRYSESFNSGAILIIETLLAPMKNSWYLVHTKKNNSAKDKEGKKYNTIVIDTLIRRTDSNWLPKDE